MLLFLGGSSEIISFLGGAFSAAICSLTSSCSDFYEMLIEELSWRLVGGGVLRDEVTFGLLVSMSVATGSTTAFAGTVF